jgi:HD superfamily phosphohydrolase
MKRHDAGRVYRDPVHDIIDWKGEGDLGRLVTELVDSREVQRLRHVRQLGMASLVFHGAEHSRFAHTMGVAHVARRFCDRVLPDRSDPRRAVVVASALLHDVGHGPFSHVMERVFGYHHEDLSVAILRDPDAEVHRALRRFDPALVDAVADHVSGRATGCTQAILSSQFDADRADYLLRDALMTGVEVGRYDLERILLLLEADDEGLVVGWGAYESLEGYLTARYHMYRLVYFHRAVRAAEGMLKQLFARARTLSASGDATISDGGTLCAMLEGGAPDASAWSRLGDYHAWSLIARWCDHADPVLRTLARGLRDRRLFRSVDIGTSDRVSPERLEAAREQIEESLSTNERCLFFVDDASDVPYRPYLPGDASPSAAVRIRGRDGHIHAIEQHSALVRALADSTYRLRRWCFHRDLSVKIEPHLAALRREEG